MIKKECIHGKREGMGNPFAQCNATDKSQQCLKETLFMGYFIPRAPKESIAATSAPALTRSGVKNDKK